MTRTVLALVLALPFAVACAEKTAPATPAGEVNVKDLYTVESAAPAEVQAGEKGTFRLAVKPKAHAHVKPETPFKTTLSATAPVQLGKTELGYADHARVEGEGPVFEVPFEASAPGAGAISADMVFFVCTAEACMRTTEQVQVPVTVKE